MPYKVVLWTTGHVARFAGRAILDHPDMEIVGCYAWSPDKVGRDVGELLDRDPIGVFATKDVDALLALQPDVLAYYPLLVIEQIPEHVDTLCRFLEQGVNVVSSANVITGRWWNAEERFADAGRRGGASLFAGGVNPGFINALTLTAASVCSEIRHISIWEEAECSGYASIPFWEAVGFGFHPEDPVLEKLFRQGTAVFEDTVAMMADCLELPLDEIRYEPEIAVAVGDLDLGWWVIKDGHVAGLRNRWLGVAGGREIIELGTVWKMTDLCRPDFAVRHGWHITIDGLPTVKAHIAGWPPEGESNSEVLMGLAMLMTALPTVHAIPHVVAARPGVVTYKDLPLITAAKMVKI